MKKAGNIFDIIFLLLMLFFVFIDYKYRWGNEISRDQTTIDYPNDSIALTHEDSMYFGRGVDSTKEKQKFDTSFYGWLKYKQDSVIKSHKY